LPAVTPLGQDGDLREGLVDDAEEDVVRDLDQPCLLATLGLAPVP
jgi:hypothetical protein